MFLYQNRQYIVSHYNLYSVINFNRIILDKRNVHGIKIKGSMRKIVMIYDNQGSIIKL